MNSSVWSYVSHQLLYHTPIFLAALIGLVLSLIFLNRSRWPSLLTLCAMLILLLGTLVFGVIEGYLFAARASGTASYTSAEYGQFLSGMNLLSSLMKAFAICLLLMAVFLGRRRAPEPLVAE